MAYSGPFKVRYQGRTLLEQQSVRYRLITGNASVFTSHKGYAGHSRGASHIELAVENAIPGDGLEIDWPGLALLQDEVEVEVEIAGVTYGCVGDIRDVDQESDQSGGEARPNKLSFSYTGRIVSRSTSAA